MQNRVKSGTLLFYLYRQFYGSFLSCVKNILLEKEKATPSSSLAWRIPWTEETGELSFIVSQSQTRVSIHAHKGWWGEGEWFQNDSSTLHLLCTLFLLLLHQLHLRSSGIRSWSLGTPALAHSLGDFAHGKFSYVLFPFGRHFPMVLSEDDLAPYGVYEDIFSPCNLAGDVSYPGIWLNIRQCTRIAPIAKNDPNPNINDTKVEKFCSILHILFLPGVYWALWTSPNGWQCTWGEIGLIILGQKAGALQKLLLYVMRAEIYLGLATCILYAEALPFYSI